jgi:transmembrane sensor
MSDSTEQMRALIIAQALEWFVTHRSGELSEAQRQAFIDWLRASPAHAREYLALTGFVEDLGEVARGFTTPTETLLARARAEIDVVQPLFPMADLADAQRDPPPKRYRAGMWAALGGVAVAAVIAVLFGAWWLHGGADYSTAHAEQRSWRMPDGSTVHLNSESEIKIRFDDERREVELIRGQALFQVAKDPRRPFWVQTGDAVAKALGTEFDVYRQAQGTVISVVEGRVAVWRADAYGRAIHVIEPPAGTAHPEPIAQLDAGQQARISHGAAVVSRRAGDVRKIVAWLQRQVVFDHDPLGSAIEEFNRYDQLRIRIDDPALRAAEISGIFSAYDVESFLRFLERQPEMRVRRIGNEVVVSAAPRPQ